MTRPQCVCRDKDGTSLYHLWKWECWSGADKNTHTLPASMTNHRDGLQTHLTSTRQTRPRAIFTPQTRKDYRPKQNKKGPDETIRDLDIWPFTESNQLLFLSVPEKKLKCHMDHREYYLCELCYGLYMRFYGSFFVKKINKYIKIFNIIELEGLNSKLN